MIDATVIIWRELYKWRDTLRKTNMVIAGNPSVSNSKIHLQMIGFSSLECGVYMNRSQTHLQNRLLKPHTPLCAVDNVLTRPLASRPFVTWLIWFGVASSNSQQQSRTYLWHVDRMVNGSTMISTVYHISLSYIHKPIKTHIPTISNIPR